MAAVRRRARLSAPATPAELGDALRERWLAEYAEATPWPPQVDEIGLGELTYLFDSAPAMHGFDGDDRVVGVWGRATPAPEPRDRSRQRGFLPFPDRWSRAGFDRGHFVAHGLGGGMDMNFFPQRADLNRGISAEGRRWRELEAIALRHRALLFVRPLYDGPTWVPARLEFGVYADGRLAAEMFDNRAPGQERPASR